MNSAMLADRRAWAFVVGTLALAIGVILHSPMFWMGRSMGFRMAGMPMAPDMIAGMWMIIAVIERAAAGRGRGLALRGRNDSR